MGLFWLQYRMRPLEEKKNRKHFVCHQRVHVIPANVFVCPVSRKHMLARHREGLVLVRGHMHTRVERIHVHVHSHSVAASTTHPHTHAHPLVSTHRARWHSLILQPAETKQSHDVRRIWPRSRRSASRFTSDVSHSLEQVVAASGVGGGGGVGADP